MAWAQVELETPKLLQQCLLPSALWTAVLSSGCLESPWNWTGPRARPNWGVGLACLRAFPRWWIIYESLPISASLCQSLPAQAFTMSKPLRHIWKAWRNCPATSTSQRGQGKGNKVYELPVSCSSLGLHSSHAKHNTSDAHTSASLYQENDISNGLFWDKTSNWWACVQPSTRTAKPRRSW